MKKYENIFNEQPKILIVRPYGLVRLVLKATKSILTAARARNVTHRLISSVLLSTLVLILTKEPFLIPPLPKFILNRIISN